MKEWRSYVLFGIISLSRVECQVHDPKPDCGAIAFISIMLFLCVSFFYGGGIVMTICFYRERKQSLLLMAADAEKNVNAVEMKEEEGEEEEEVTVSTEEISRS